MNKMNKEEKTEQIDNQKDELVKLIEEQERVISRMQESHDFVMNRQNQNMSEEQKKLEILQLKLQAFDEFKIL